MLVERLHQRELTTGDQEAAAMKKHVEVIFLLYAENHLLTLIKNTKIVDKIVALLGLMAIIVQFIKKFRH